MIRRTATAVLMYSLVACVFTWPLALHPHARFGALDPTGDPSLYLWALGWDLHTLASHPAWLLTGRVFNAGIFFPAPLTLAYSDHLLLQAVALWPVFAVTRDLVFCYNVLLIGSLIAAALSMHVLARALTGSEAAAFVAGLIFGFAPFHFTHLLHIQLQALYFLPLSFLFLHRLFADERRSDTIALGVVTGLQTVSSVYYGVIGAIGLACAVAVLMAATGRITDWRLLRRGAAAAALALLVAAPWSIPYLRVARDAGGGRTSYEASNGSAVVSSYLQAPAMNLVYGRTGWLRPGGRAPLPFKDGPEQALFFGFVAMLLAAAGAVAAPQRLKQIAAVYSVLALVGLVLSLGPNGIRAVYTALYGALVGMAAIRASARFSVLTLLGVAVLAALAVRALELRRPRVGRFVGAAAFGLIAVEFCNGAIAFPAPPALTTPAGRWLSQQPGSGAVVCAPVGPFASNTPCMLQSLEHGRPIVNGYSGFRPPFFEALLDAVNRLPAAQALVTLHDLGVEFVVSDGPLEIGPESRDVLVERASFGAQRIYQVVWSPATDARLAATTGVIPPDPGPPPFVTGESATYRVRWTSGPMRVPAGTATIAVLPPQGQESYRFQVLAKTEPWMSRFYEADVLMEATVDGGLLPFSYREAITDGKRRIERQAAFDTGRHEMRLTSGGASITLPLDAFARDPLTALFYIRGLPLQAGSHVALPLSDNGRRLTLEVAVRGVETVTLDGHPRSTWRLEPRLTDRSARRGPLDVTAWLSADAHRVPLIIDVAAAFGSARLEARDLSRALSQLLPMNNTLVPAPADPRVTQSRSRMRIVSALRRRTNLSIGKQEPTVRLTVLSGMGKFLVWCLLLVLCWPLALLALVLYPVAWLVLLPFRIVGIAVDGVLGLISGIVLLPARLLRGPRSL